MGCKRLRDIPAYAVADALVERGLPHDDAMDVLVEFVHAVEGLEKERDAAVRLLDAVHKELDAIDADANKQRDEGWPREAAQQDMDAWRIRKILIPCHHHASVSK